MGGDRGRGRPEVSASLTADDVAGWYWTLDELRQVARLLGVSAGGSKAVLTQRLVAGLSGTPFSEPPARRPPAPPLPQPLHPGTTIPAGQRCTQELRRWFQTRVGPGFRFDAAMRDLIGSADGSQTLDDAVRHWHATRDAPATEIPEQFELNRFTRTWRHDHPGGTHDQLLAAWRAYRDSPVERRGRA